MDDQRSHVVWRKARASGGNGQCVEVADTASAQLLRDSKLGDLSPILSFPPEAFAAFVNAVRSGEFGS